MDIYKSTTKALKIPFIPLGLRSPAGDVLDAVSQVWIIGILVIRICLGFEFWDLGFGCHLSCHRNSIPRMNSWAILNLSPCLLGAVRQAVFCFPRPLFRALVSWW